MPRGQGNPFDAAGRLWVMNQGNARYSVYDTSGALLQGLPRFMAARVTEWVGVFDSSGALYDELFYPSPTGLRFSYARYDTVTGSFVDAMPGVGAARAPLLGCAAWDAVWLVVGECSGIPPVPDHLCWGHIADR